MLNKFKMGSFAMCVMAVMFGFEVHARTFEFKQLKSTGTTGSAEYWWEGTEKSKSSWFQVKIGGATKIDDTSEMEIRAATVLKSVKDKKTGINDVATFEFDPINKGKAIFFMISTGSAFSKERESYYYGNVSIGWQLAGVIIEVWQKGKVVKHWSNMSGKDGKTKLVDDIKKLRINRDGHPSTGERYYSARDFDNATEIYSVDQKGERVDIDEVLKPFRESEEDDKTASTGDETSAAQTPVKNTVAPKLRTCEFLLNKKFKKNAKFYLCLFSASWCPPCRAEMPRIAKAYAETLKDDPDIELIHFSRDQDDEKAMAWAKEHDVKFPVVRPRGGNPLDLHSRGIPHLFIVKADGTLVEEGHPMRIFNEEKFREIKGENLVAGAAPQVSNDGTGITVGTAQVDGYTLAYRVRNGEVSIAAMTGGRFSCAISPKPTGHFSIPSTIGGMKVTSIGDNAFYYCDRMESVIIPTGVTSIGNAAFEYCRRLNSVTIPEGVMRIGSGAFYQCWSLPSVMIPASVLSISDTAFLYCSDMQQFKVDPANKNYKSVNGLLLTKDGTRLIAGINGSVVIPSGVKSIGRNAFLERRRLTAVTIPEGVTSIGEWAFSSCSEIGRGDSGLFEVTLPDSVTSIGRGAFRDCSGLKQFVVGVGNRSYRSENGLLLSKDGKRLVAGVNGDVDIPNGVTIIDDLAFDGCDGLITLTVPASVMSIGMEAFRECSGLRQFSVDGGNKAYKSENGLLLSKDGSLLVAGVNGEVVIPSSVKKIEDHAFHGCRELTAVTIPSSVATIGKEAFGCCFNLKKVTVGRGDVGRVKSMLSSDRFGPKVASIRFEEVDF